MTSPTTRLLFSTRYQANGVSAGAITATATGTALTLTQSPLLIGRNTTRPQFYRHALPPPYVGHHVRCSSHSPMGGPVSTSSRKKVTTTTLRNLYKNGEPITALTAHDFPSSHIADAAGIELILVGDSLAMVSMGMEDTSEILLEEMLLHCRSVSRAAKSSFTVRLRPFFFSSLLPPAACSRSVWFN